MRREIYRGESMTEHVNHVSLLQRRLRTLVGMLDKVHAEAEAALDREAGERSALIECERLSSAPWWAEEHRG